MNTNTAIVTTYAILVTSVIAVFILKKKGLV